MELGDKDIEGELERMVELETKRQLELKRRREEEAQQLKEVIDENPRRFIEYMCEAVLNIDREGGNPFLVTKDSPGVSKVLLEMIERGNSYLRGLANIVLNKLRDVEPIKCDDGYVPFINLAIDCFSVSENISGEEIVEYYDLLAIQHKLFNSVADGFSMAIDTACHYVFEGVPLYRRLSDEHGYERVDFDDPLYHYIYKKGEYFESGSTLHVPDWMDGLYVKSSDMDAHSSFFHGEMELDGADRDRRRRALWNEIGVFSPVIKGSLGETSQTHRTKLLDVTQAVISRYYGPQFNESDPSTVTSQKVIVDWLMETYGLSRRAAEAIDIVTRPDSRR